MIDEALTYQTKLDKSAIQKIVNELEYFTSNAPTTADYKGKNTYTIWSSAKNPKVIDIVPEDVWDHYGISKKDCKVELIKLRPGQFSEPHRDGYNNYIKNFPNTDKDDLISLWISASEPKLGHALFLSDKDVVYNVPAGYCINVTHLFSNNTHSGANAGEEDRFFITVLGQKA